MEEDMVHRTKEAISEIPCQVKKLPVLRVILVTNSANNGGVLAGAFYIKESATKAGEYRGNLKFLRTRID